MTKEEIIAYGKDYYRDLTLACCEIDKKHKEFVRMSLEALSQEPKSGHWIYDRTIENWRCTECDKPPKIRGYVGTLEFMREHFKHCPNCGAKMDEPQESEEQTE